MTKAELARYIDHTALKPETTDDGIVTLCTEAHLHGFASVCVMPYYVPLATRTLKELGSSVAVCAAIGFPIGAHHSVVKITEAQRAVHDGARELDMVINIGALLSGHDHLVASDVRAVAETARQAGAILKVIIETALLSDDQKRQACAIAERAGADFVKTSTGFAGGGATVEDIRLIRAASPASMKIKASGGIRDYATAIAMIEAGADRIGTSAGPAIIAGAAG
jgi:deoxyribose-phosphate aldolase